jgi:integrase
MSAIKRSKRGLVFATSESTPLRQSNELRRTLHPILETLGIEKQGFHGFRRFRAAHLSKQNCNHNLMQFWIGHSTGNITDLYAGKISRDIDYRHKETERIGVGFDILTAPVVTNVTKFENFQNSEMAACT